MATKPLATPTSPVLIFPSVLEIEPKTLYMVGHYLSSNHIPDLMACFAKKQIKNKTTLFTNLKQRLPLASETT